MILEAIEILENNLSLTFEQLQSKVTNGDYNDLLTNYNLLIMTADGLVLINKNDKICKVIAPTDLENYLTPSSLVPQSYKDIQKIVRAGLGSKVFNIGDQIIVSKGNTELVWDIIGIDHDIPVDNNYSHSLTLQLHDCFASAVMFDNSEATWYIDADTYPNGLVAGTYYFTLPSGYDTAYGGGSTFNFTLTKNVPIGGQVWFRWPSNTQASTCSIYTYASVGTSTVLETVTVVEGESGIAMPAISTTAVTNNTNCIHRSRYGSNNWSQSSIRQWLNTDKDANTWWEPQTVFDRPGTVNVDGFLKNIDSEFLAVLGEVTKTTQKSIFDGYGLNTSNEKIFLLSRPEVYGGIEYSTDGADGTVYPYYNTEYSDLSSAAMTADTNRIKNRNGSPYYWWLRTPYAGSGNNPRLVYPSGSVSILNAYSPYGAAPACVIV